MHRWLLTDFEQVILLTLDKLEKNISHFTDFIQVKKISSFLARKNVLI